jgi:hypothetical protein
MFTYSEPTPRKNSPKIVAPRSFLDRLSVKGRRHIKRNKEMYADDSLSNRQPLQEEESRVVSLHHSLMDPPASLLFQYDDDENENHSVQSVQSVQSAASSLAGSLAGSVASLTKVKLRLRRKSKKKSRQEPEITILSPLKELETYKNKEVKKVGSKKQILFQKALRRTSTGSTKSQTSRASSLSGMDVPAPCSPTARPGGLGRSSQTHCSDDSDKSKREDDGIPTSVEVRTPPKPMTSPPPVATLKAAMEIAATKVAQKPSTTVNSMVPDKARRASEPIVKLRSPPIDSSDSKQKSRDAVDPLLSGKSPVTGVCVVSPQNQDFKIYLLLLHPKSKIFELIQLFFDPSTTTIRDVMSMIPDNATEKALGTQAYTGLVRPQKNDEDEEEITNLDLLVQNYDNMRKSAQIMKKEVLIAVPEGYSGKECAILSQGILRNPRIRKLLEGRSSRKSHRRRRRSSALKSVEVLDRHDEEKPTETESLVHYESIQEAMEKAEKAAAVANAAVHELPRRRSLVMAVGKTFRYTVDHNGKGPIPDISLESALQSLDGSSVSASLTDVSERSYSMHSYENSIDRTEYSLDKSLSSWSRSLDSSFAGASIVRNGVNASTLGESHGQPPLMANPALRRRSKQMKMVARVAVGVVILMCTSYFADSNGFASRHWRRMAFYQPMGLPGLVQVVLIFMTLVKIQFVCIFPAMHSSNCSKSRCPFMKSRASFLEGTTLQTRKTAKYSR